VHNDLTLGRKIGVPKTADLKFEHHVSSCGVRMENFRAIRFIAGVLRAQVRQHVLKLGFILFSLVALQLTGCGSSSGSGTGPSSSAPFSVGGTVSGLSGNRLVLINNDVDVLTVSANGPFKFRLTSSTGGMYSVLIATPPPGQVCTVTNGSGVVAKADITDVDVNCETGPEETLHTFSGGTDGSYPDSGFTEGPDGNFYGTTTLGGANNLGTVYKITPSGVKTVLYSFAGGPSDGQYPASGLELGNDGDFYVTTTAGGAFGFGTFFKITLDGAETVLYSFGGNGSGTTPQGLAELPDGNFYGTTTAGGANNLGTVYKMSPAGEQTILYSFASGTDGNSPAAGLSQDIDGNLYGVTYYGGSNNFGTIFRVAPDGTGYTILHSFSGGATDGQYPGVKLRNVGDGSLYGSTTAGGAEGLGTIFRYVPGSGVTTVIHSFSGAPDDGNHPSCRLRVGNDGNLYGVTFYGGYFDLGTFFEITPAGVLNVLYSFSGGADGQGPNSSLLLTSAGDFYGTTNAGGPANNGTIYKINP
jgi:uncharacterized repeat protein (TIGR03803 family)